MNDPIRLEFKLICKFGEDPIKTTGKGGDTIFLIISQWEFLVAMTTTVVIQSAPLQPFPYPIDATHKIWPRLANSGLRDMSHNMTKPTK